MENASAFYDRMVKEHPEDDEQTRLKRRKDLQSWLKQMRRHNEARSGTQLQMPTDVTSSISSPLVEGILTLGAMCQHFPEEDPCRL